MHAHRCPGCGTVWHHGPENFGDQDEHTCPKCDGGPVWLVYHRGARAGVPWLAIGLLVVGVALIVRGD